MSPGCLGGEARDPRHAEVHAERRVRGHRVALQLQRVVEVEGAHPPLCARGGSEEKGTGKTRGGGVSGFIVRHTAAAPSARLAVRQRRDEWPLAGRAVRLGGGHLLRRRGRRRPDARAATEQHQQHQQQRRRDDHACCDGGWRNEAEGRGRGGSAGGMCRGRSSQAGRVPLPRGRCKGNLPPHHEPSRPSAAHAARAYDRRARATEPGAPRASQDV